MPNSVTSIGDLAFTLCTSLTSITIGNSVTSIGSRAFSLCTSLTGITIPDSVTSIGSSAFYLCSNLTSINIGNSVTSIGVDAFSGCSSLTSITLPDSVTSIGGFGGLDFLERIIFEGDAPDINTLPSHPNIYYYGGNSGFTSPTWKGADSFIIDDLPLSPVLSLDSFYESNSGESITIYATPVGGFPSSYTYQWYSNNFPIPSNYGGINAFYTIDGVSLNEGTWRVVVTNDTGSTEASFEYRVFTDADSDGLSDYRESNITNTNPSLADTDSDGLNDFVELNTTLTDPNDSDSDDDTLLDGAEVNTHGSDPNDTDSDDDGLLDDAEVNTYNTSPIDADSDNDTLADNQEILTYFTNPNLADSDSDGLSDAAELNTYLSLPNTSDTDGDGLTDGDEVNIHSSSPIDSDSDDDTILDGIEVRHATFGFDPAVDSSTRLAALIALVEEFPGVLTDAQRQGLSLGGVSLTPRAGGGLSFDFIIEESEDLSTWTTVNTVSHTLDTTGTKKFIRVRKTPQ